MSLGRAQFESRGTSQVTRNLRVISAIALVIVVPATAYAKTDATVVEALRLHASGKPGEAYALLKPQVAARAGDPDFDYALGIAAADSGRAGEAIVALQRVLAVHPDNAQARAEIARAYAIGGDIDTARAQFDTVIADPTLPDPVRQRFNRIVRDYKGQIDGGARSLTGYAEIESGYDSNINAATGLSTITLPVFAFLGPATLGGGATRIDRAFVQGQAGISGTYTLGRQTRLFASALGLWRENLKSSAFDQQALTGTLGVAHSFANRDTLSVAGQLQNFWLGGDSFRLSYGGTVQYSHALRGGAALSASAGFTRFDYRDPTRNADRLQGGISYAGRTVYASVAGGTERMLTGAAPHLGFDFASGAVGAEIPLAPRLAVTASAGIEHRAYRAPDPLYGANRRDTQGDVSLGLRYVLTGALSVRPRVTYTRNTSNLSLYDYERVTASLSLRAEF